jgi:hypothetical protein
MFARGQGTLSEVVSYFAVVLCGFAPLREGRIETLMFTQRRQGAKTRKVKLDTIFGDAHLLTGRGQLRRRVPQ